jgi:hypothetical protein
MAAVFLFAGGHTFAYGEDYRVVTEEDFPHWKPGIGACEIAPGDERCTLRAAIMEANARPGKDRIIVPSGTYVLSNAAIVDDVSIFGDLDVTDDLVIEGAGVGVTILDGGSQDRVLDVHGARVEVSGLSLRNGNTVEIGESGGAVRSSSNLTLTRVSVSASKGRVAEDCVRARQRTSPDDRCAADGASGVIASTGSLTLTHVSVDGRSMNPPGKTR